MARTKGAKGKKTLAKEKGMTLEQYLEYERNTALEKIIGVESINQILNPELKTLNETLKEKEEIKEKKPESIKEEEPKQELVLEMTVNETDIKGEIKDKTIETEDSEIKIKTRKKKDKEVICCERCHKPITGLIPFKINLTYLTTVPDYHRQTPSDRVQLCDSCIKELSNIVDKWLWNNGEGMELKYGQKEFQEKEF